MRLAVMLVAVGAVGCGGRPIGGADAGDGLDGGTPPLDDGAIPMTDAEPPPDRDGGGVDAFVPPGVDAGPPPPGASRPAEPTTVASTGTGGFLLRGTVLAPSGVIDPGEVLVVGDEIRCVAASCAAEPMAGSVTVIETRSVISPGLIDAHNHLTYNFLDEWVAGTTYGSRYAWSDVPAYEDWVAPYAADMGPFTQSDRVCLGAKWGELRSIIHGTTTVQGQSFNRACLNRLARNADHHHGLGYDHMQTTIASPRDITDAQAATLVANFTDASTPTTRYAIHMQEGLTGNNIETEFDSFAGRDTRTNRHMGTSLLAEDGMYAGVGLLIHSMGLTAAQLDEVRDTDASIVWSPSSNIVLYGATAPIEEMLARDLTIGMGPDWTVSGEDEMLSEMRFGYAYGLAEGIGALTPERIWRMATAGSADAVGLGASIGRLEVGQRADIVVFGRTAADPYRAVLESRAEDVRLVLIDGEGYYGELALEAATAVNGDCDMIDACGAMRYLCLANTPGATTSTARAGETLDEVHSQLVSLMELYGRASDLLELVACE